MQQLMASLVFGMSVDDAAYRAGMASARGEARKTEQDFDRAGSGMADAIQRSALAVNRAALSMVDSFNNAVSGVKRAGLAMTVGLTVPLGLAGKSAKDTASDFQAAMGKVQAAMLTADPREIEKLRDAALELGPAMGRSAIEAAGAIESLAKNGMSAAAILGGGLQSALTLATVGETDLSKAADLTTDIMAQFGKTAGDLPRVVDLVSGALDASKMGFDDYRLAAGNAGGIVGALGYTFEDFNAGLAATAPLFDSGASAGTSYRAFLTSLIGKSEDARRAMKQLGLEFYNADGSAKSLAAIADQLQKKMGNLSTRSRGTFLNAMFGDDGAQTAVKLIQLGAKGVEDAQRAINGVSADQKIAVLLDGEAASTQRLASSWERLKIAIGESGLIQVMTAIKNVTAGAIAAVAGLPPAFHYGFVAMAALAAAAGPVVLALAAIVGIAAPLIVGMGSIGIAGRILVGVVGAIINPVGMLGRGLLFIAARAGAATVVARLSTALAGVLGPIGLVITGAAILWPMIKALGDVSATTAEAQEKAAQAHGAAENALTRLATSTGKARIEALAHVKALRAEGVEALITARKNVIAARSRYLDAKKNEEDAKSVTGIGAAWRGSPLALWLSGRKNSQGAGKDFIAQGQIVLDKLADLEKMDAAIAGAAKGGGAPLDIDLADPEKKGRKGRVKAGRDVAADQARYDDELGRLKVDALRAQADLSEGIRSRYTAEMAALAEERSNYARQLANDDALNAAKRQTLLAAKDEEMAVRRTIAERDLSDGLAQEEYDLFAARNDAEQEIVRASIDLADSVAVQRAGQLRLLALQRQREEADIELVLATKATSSAEWQNASDRRRTLDERYARQEVGIRRQTEGPGESYIRSLNMSSDGMLEAIQAGGVDALRGLNSELLQAGFNAQKLGDAFANTAKRIISSLADIAIQQKIIKPMAEALFGERQSGGGGFLAGLFKAAGMAASAAGGGGMTGGNGSLGSISPGDVSSMGLIPINFGGYRAKGGPIEPNKWYRVGENGPEDLFTGRAGTVLPNGALDAAGGRRGTVVQQTINFTGGVDLATRTEVYRVADAARQAAITGIRDVDRRRG